MLFDGICNNCGGDGDGCAPPTEVDGVPAFQTTSCLHLEQFFFWQYINAWPSMVNPPNAFSLPNPDVWPGAQPTSGNPITQLLGPLFCAMEESFTGDAGNPAFDYTNSMSFPLCVPSSTDSLNYIRGTIASVASLLGNPPDQSAIASLPYSSSGHYSYTNGDGSVWTLQYSSSYNADSALDTFNSYVSALNVGTTFDSGNPYWTVFDCSFFDNPLDGDAQDFSDGNYYAYSHFTGGAYAALILNGSTPGTLFAGAPVSCLMVDYIDFQGMPALYAVCSRISVPYTSPYVLVTYVVVVNDATVSLVYESCSDAGTLEANTKFIIPLPLLDHSGNNLPSSLFTGTQVPIGRLVLCVPGCTCTNFNA